MLQEMRNEMVQCNTDRSQHVYEEEELVGKRGEEGSRNWTSTLRSLRDEIRS